MFQYVLALNLLCPNLQHDPYACVLGLFPRQHVSWLLFAEPSHAGHYKKKTNPSLDHLCIPGEVKKHNSRRRILFLFNDHQYISMYLCDAIHFNKFFF